MPKFEKLSLNNLCGGAAHELFEREMDGMWRRAAVEYIYKYLATALPEVPVLR